LCDVCSPSGELVAKRLGIAISDVCAQCLNPRPVGWGAAGLPAATDEHLGAALARAARDLLKKAALADSGLAADQVEPALAGKRLVEALEELAQLGCAPDERSGPSAEALHREVLVKFHGRGRLERRVVGEDCSLEILERLARFQAELLRQQAPCLLVALERLRLAPGTVERKHQLPA
jgi:hypothetical protein